MQGFKFLGSLTTCLLTSYFSISKDPSYTKQSCTYVPCLVGVDGEIQIEQQWDGRARHSCPLGG